MKISFLLLGISGFAEVWDDRDGVSYGRQDEKRLPTTTSSAPARIGWDCFVPRVTGMRWSGLTPAISAEWFALSARESWITKATKKECSDGRTRGQHSLQGRCESRGAVFHMAGRPRESVGLEGGRQNWTQGRMPGAHQRGLDRHAATQPEKEDGRSSPEILATRDRRLAAFKYRT